MPVDIPRANLHARHRSSWQIALSHEAARWRSARCWQTTPRAGPFGPWTGSCILCGYTALILVLSAMLVRRDA
jgi:hypothetical protein